MIGMTTGIGGGAVRDLLLREIPLVLRKEIYAVAALAGFGARRRRSRSATARRAGHRRGGRGRGGRADGRALAALERAGRAWSGVRETLCVFCVCS